MKRKKRKEKEIKKIKDDDGSNNISDILTKE